MTHGDPCMERPGQVILFRPLRPIGACGKCCWNKWKQFKMWLCQCDKGHAIPGRWLKSQLLSISSRVRRLCLPPVIAAGVIKAEFGMECWEIGLRLPCANWRLTMWKISLCLRWYLPIVHSGETTPVERPSHKSFSLPLLTVYDLCLGSPLGSLSLSLSLSRLFCRFHLSLLDEKSTSVLVSFLKTFLSFPCFFLCLYAWSWHHGTCVCACSGGHWAISPSDEAVKELLGDAQPADVHRRLQEQR